MAEQKQASEVQAALDAVLSLHGVQFVDLDDSGAKVAVLPSGVTLTSVKHLIDQYAVRPDRKEGTAALTSIESFIAFVNRHKDESSAVFANTGEQPALTAVFDYHDVKGGNDEARFCKHRALYAFPLSKEWTAWKVWNDKWFEQGQFASFIEERIADVADPSQANDAVNELLAKIECSLAGPAKLMALSRGLSVSVESKVVNTQRLNSGESNLVFETNHRDSEGKPLSVPGAFLLTIPLFRGGALYRVPVRLRYRVSQGKVMWSYALYRTEEIFDHAVQEAIKKVATSTELPVFEGAPER